MSLTENGLGFDLHTFTSDLGHKGHGYEAEILVALCRLSTRGCCSFEPQRKTRKAPDTFHGGLMEGPGYLLKERGCAVEWEVGVRPTPFQVITLGCVSPGLWPVTI